MSDKFPGGLITTGAPAGFSVAFGATTSKLSIASMTALGSDFTIECWVYPTSFADYNTIWDNRASDADANGCVLALNAANKVYFYTNSSFQLTTTTALTANRWTHLALVRSGSGSGNVKIYINGVADATTATYTTSFSRTAASIGGDWNTRSNLQFFGYISNFRTLTTALYTTTFTPPTQLFPVTSTTLLTCQSPTIIDNSSSAVAITLAGSTTPAVSNFTPFAAYQGFNPALGAAAGGVWTLDEAAYYQNNRQWPIYDPYFKNTTLMLHGNGTNAAQNNTFLDSSTNNFTITRNGNTTQGSFTPFSQTGWSNYFNGAQTTPSLSFPNNAAYSIGSTSDFTVEAFVYFTNGIGSSSEVSLVERFDGTSGPGWIFGKNSSDNFWVGFGGATYAGSTTLSANRWYHLCWMRTGGSSYIFVNGVLNRAPITTANFTDGSSPLCLGERDGVQTFPFTGYMTNVRIVKGTAVYPTGGFTVPTSPLTAVTNTSLLTCQDNRFVDGSAINATPTVGAASSVQAFSPFVPAYITPTTYSNWFNKSTGYLTVPSNTAFNFSTGDFTIECWVWFNQTADASGGGQCVVSGTSAGYPVLYISTNGGTTLSFAHSSSIVVGGTIQTRAWNHVAISRSGSSLRFFVNGILAQTATYSTAIDFGGVYIGAQSVGGVIGFIDGAISNLRMLKGTALYTANFTPPTAPLTNITNTSLLTCQSSTLIDNSTANSGSAFTVTAVGGVQPVTSPTPFPAKVDTTTLNSAYSTSLIGGSGYFDGTGDYLTLPANAAFNFNTGDFTLETWIYMPSFSTFQEIFSQGSGNFQGIGIYTTTSGKVHLDLGNGSSWYANAETTNSLKLNSWNHVAVVRQSTTYTIYLNGASDATTTTATFPSDASGASSYIGVYGPLTSQLFTGYMSGFRIVKGSAVYTSNFAPPTLPPTAVTNTQLLTNFTNGAIFDNTAKNVLETVGNAQISTTQSKWGGSSMYFDGSGDYLFVNSSANNIMSLGTGDFTVETWVNFSNISNNPCICSGYVDSSNGWYFQYYSNAIELAVGSTALISKAATVSNGTWYHMAVTRAGGTLRAFLNGVQQGTSVTGSTTNLNVTNGFYVGILNSSFAPTTRTFAGYLDDLRITKGVARYTTDFTPPTSQLQDQ